MVKDPLHREHVCLNIVENPEIFSSINVIAPPNLHFPELEVLLDEQDDHDLICHLIENLSKEYPYFDCHRIIEYIRANPEVSQINAKVKRKGAT